MRQRYRQASLPDGFEGLLGEFAENALRLGLFSLQLSQQERLEQLMLHQLLLSIQVHLAKPLHQHLEARHLRALHTRMLL